MSRHDRGDEARAPCRRLSPRPKAERRTTKPPLNHPDTCVATKPPPHVLFNFGCVSTWCFLAAWLVVRRNPSRSDQTSRGFLLTAPQGCFLTAARVKAIVMDIGFVVRQSVRALVRTIVKASLGTSVRASIRTLARTSGSTSVRAFVRSLKDLNKEFKTELQ